MMRPRWDHPTVYRIWAGSTPVMRANFVAVRVYCAVALGVNDVALFP